MAKKNDIAKVETAAIQSVEQIESLILTIRGKQVILDRDLARLYSVETRVLNQAVQRNIERFPEDFMFRLTKEEFENWKSQFVISNYDEENMSSQFVTTYNPNMSSQNAITSPLVGACLKDLGKKWFGFTKMEQTTDELLSKM